MPLQLAPLSMLDPEFLAIGILCRAHLPVEIVCRSKLEHALMGLISRAGIQENGDVYWAFYITEDLVWLRGDL